LEPVYRKISVGARHERLMKTYLDGFANSPDYLLKYFMSIGPKIDECIIKSWKSGFENYEENNARGTTTD
jgi:hypothetical protein